MFCYGNACLHAIYYLLTADLRNIDFKFLFSFKDEKKLKEEEDKQDEGTGSVKQEVKEQVTMVTPRCLF